MGKALFTAMLAVGLAASPGAWAADEEAPRTVKDYLAACDGSDTNAAAFCLGEMAGISYVMSLNAAHGIGVRTCPPKGTSFEQRRRVFIDWARDNRAFWDKPGPRGIAYALLQAWPCDYKPYSGRRGAARTR